MRLSIKKGDETREVTLRNGKKEEKIEKDKKCREKYAYG